MKNIQLTKFLGVLALVTFLVTSSKAQDQVVPKNQLGLSVGTNQGFFKDLNHSTLHFNTSGILLGINYERTKGNGLFITDLHYSSGKAPSTVSDYIDMIYLKGGLQFGYLKKTNFLADSKFKTYLGGHYDFSINYYEWDNQDAFSFFANHSFELAGQLNFDLNEKHRFSAKLEIPIVSLIVRPPYNANDEELGDNFDNGKIFNLITDGDWGSFNKLVSYDFTLKYKYVLSEKFDLNVNYQNSFDRTSGPLRINLFQNHLALGATLKF